MSLKVAVEKRKEGYYVVTLDGKIDTLTYLLFEEKIDPLLVPSTEMLMLDMKNVNYISSMGLRSIFKARKLLKPHNGKLIATNIQPHIAKVFDVVLALPKESIFQSVEEADAYFDFIQQQELSKQRKPS